MSWPGYLASLIGSWRALAVPAPGAEVRTGPGWAASVFPSQPVLDNAVLLEPDGLSSVRACYPDTRRFAVWTADEPCAAAVQGAGFVEDTMTWPMTCVLADLPAADHEPVGVSVAPEVVADLNGVDPAMLADVPGLRTYGSTDGAAVVALIAVDDDVNVSFVATREDARRRGLATAVLRTALALARADGFVTSALQATAMARGVYGRLGYREVGCWQEWTPPEPAEAVGAS